MNKKPRRKINGLLLLDKPLGMSSNQAVQISKRLFSAEKAGHTGSLDPFASGMLPICFGEATKFSQFLLDADKTYEVQAKLGETTTTFDVEGEIISQKPVPELSTEIIDQVFAQFRGKISQVPPMYSALKHQGQPLYKLARQGKEVAREPRQVTLFSLDIISYDAPVIHFTVRCSKGTYIRSLVDDIGKVIGCGAHVANLRRTDVDQFPREKMLDFATLEKFHDENNVNALDQFLLSPDLMCQHFHSVTLSQMQIADLRLGRFIAFKQDIPPQIVRVYDSNAEFQGIAELTSELLQPKKMIVNI